MSKFKVGEKVCYTPNPNQRLENGIIKTVHLDGDKYWVVYNCGLDWKNYRNYTGALTRELDLQPGWVDLRELKELEFRCPNCFTIHKKATHEIAQDEQGHQVIFTCDCDNKVYL